MNRSDERKMTELQELMCDGYCRHPGSCSSQGELDKHCDSCRMVRLWNFVSRKNGTSEIQTEVRQIADHYKLGSQTAKLVGECAEFIQAAMKLRAIQDNPSKENMAQLSAEMNNWYVELADLSLMLEQVIYLSDKAGEVDQIRQEKIKRTLKLIAVNKA